MSLRDRNYWIERAKEKVIWNEEQANDAVKEIMFIYDETANEVENRINAMYQKYATDNNLTLSQAQQLISGKEYSVWQKSIEEYLADLTGDAANSKTALELNTLAMKSRISREEKLLADIYRQMATLAEDYETDLTQLLSDITASNYYRGCYNLQIGMQVGFEVGKISEPIIKSLLEYPWAKKTFSKAVWDDVDAICKHTRMALMRGFTAGYSIQKMTKEINDIMG
ncbi:MAG: minor capsid protein, partial [Brevinema sp.]